MPVPIVQNISSGMQKCKLHVSITSKYRSGICTVLLVRILFHGVRCGGLECSRQKVCAHLSHLGGRKVDVGTSNLAII